MKNRLALALAASAGIGLFSADRAQAVFKSWNVGTGNWGVSANWNPAGVPTSSDIVFLDHLVSGQRGVAHVNSTGFASPVSISIRQLNELIVDNHSSLSVGGDILVGYDESVGFLTMKSAQPGVVFFDGSLTVGNTLRLGFSGASGDVDQNDGTITVNQLVRVGDRQSSFIFPGTGRYTLGGVGVLNAARLELGWGGDTSQFLCEGEFNLSGNAKLNVSLGAQVPDPKIGGNGGIGTLNQSGGTFNSPFRIVDLGGSTGSGIYNFSGGTCAIAGLLIGATGTLNYTGGANMTVGQLNLVSGHANLGDGGGKVLRVTNLVTSVGTGNWAIDVNDNALTVLGTVGDSVPNALSRGRAGGAWTGTGITSTAARNDPNHATTLGFMPAADYTSVYGPNASFGGQPVTNTMQIVKYTWYGDTDFNGIVNFDDYVRTDDGFNNHRSGWLNGDFDANGVVSFDDYVLIDLAFNVQNGTLGRALAFLDGADRSRSGMTDPALQKVAEHASEFGADYAAHFLSAVPEPGAGCLLGAAALAGVSRRRRKVERAQDDGRKHRRG